MYICTVLTLASVNEALSERKELAIEASDALAGRNACCGIARLKVLQRGEKDAYIVKIAKRTTTFC